MQWEMAAENIGATVISWEAAILAPPFCRYRGPLRPPDFIRRPILILGFVDLHGPDGAREFSWRPVSLVADIAGSPIPRVNVWIANTQTPCLKAPSPSCALAPGDLGWGHGSPTSASPSPAPRATKMVLWTNSCLTTARHIYARRGFVLVKSEPYEGFGQHLVGRPGS